VKEHTLRGEPAARRLLEEARYEVIPLAGTEEAVERWLISRRAEEQKKTTITITASPTRGIEPTIALTERLGAKARRRGGEPSSLCVVPHLSARLIEDEHHLEEIVARLKEAGVEEVFVIGGDAKEPRGRFHDALGLLEALEELGRPFERVGIAGYPEGHPSIERAELERALRKKALYASYVVSQLCFEAKKVLLWARRVRELGVGLPVVVGVAAPIDPKRLAGIAAKIGIGDSARFLRKQRAKSLLRLLSPGRRRSALSLVYEPGGFLEELVEEGSREGLLASSGVTEEGGGMISGLHLYTFNDLQRTLEWVLEEKKMAQREGEKRRRG